MHSFVEWINTILLVSVLTIDSDVIMADINRKLFKILFSPAHCLYALLPPLKSNPYAIRPRNHNLQFPDCTLNLRRNSFIIRSVYRFGILYVFHDCHLVFLFFICMYFLTFLFNCFSHCS